MQRDESLQLASGLNLESCSTSIPALSPAPPLANPAQASSGNCFPFSLSMLRDALSAIRQAHRLSANSLY